MELNSSSYSHVAQWWHTYPIRAPHTTDIQCTLCPHRCILKDGQRGLCVVRQNQKGQMVLTNYGYSSASYLEAIENMPLYHFYPGASALSIGAAGCNLWGNSYAPPTVAQTTDGHTTDAIVSPEGIARAAAAYGAQIVAFSAQDPVVFAEYTIDTAAACRQLGIKTVAFTAAYIEPTAAGDFFAWMDAVSVNLKTFSDDFYRQHGGGRLQPVLDCLVHIRHHSHCWLEINTPLIPTLNDSPAAIRALSQWIAKELGPTVPLHFTSHTNSHQPPSALTNLVYARQIALECGLQHVYTDDRQNSEGSTSFCTSCFAVLIERANAQIQRNELSAESRCPHCQTPLAGHFGLRRKNTDIPRVPVRFVRRM